jgi:AmmeMemoRadiSam system protein B
MNDNLPTHPKLRPVEPQWVQYEGELYLYLHDRMGLAERSILVPQPIAPLLVLCDGTRDIAAIQASFALRTGVQLPLPVLRDFLAQLDGALLLENGAYRQAEARLLQDYREAAHRHPSHADLVYPSDPQGLSGLLQEYFARAPRNAAPASSNGRLVGMLCPHIDYARGHATYAQLWQRAAPSLDELELVVIFGTDHYGGLGMLTPTRQSYATPLGVLPTEQDIVEGLAEALGPEKAFAEEVHHVREHSIELAAVWLHYFLKGRACPVVPILCGSFHHFITGEAEVEEDETIGAALKLLKEATAGRKTLVIAAGDLAHVGPAFGDPQPLDALARARLTAADAESLAAICQGDADAFFARSRQESDSRRICGLSPIYMALKAIENARGESLGYAQCPADAQGGSLVSIAGVLLYEAS